MKKELLIEHWLDLWDECQHRRANIKVDEFVRQHCRGSPQDLINRFRQAVKRLSKIDRLIARTSTDETHNSSGGLRR